MLTRALIPLLLLTFLQSPDVLCKKKTKFFSHRRPDFKYCIDDFLFPRFFKSFCPGKGERWLNARAKVQSKISLLYSLARSTCTEAPCVLVYPITMVYSQL